MGWQIDSFLSKESIENLFNVKVGKSTFYTDCQNLIKCLEADTDIINDKRSRRPIGILRDAIELDLFSLKWIKSNFQAADCLTKSTGNGQMLKAILTSNKIDFL